MGELQLNVVRADWGKEHHENWTAALISNMSVGCTNLWEKPKFQLMLKGFMALLGGSCNLTIAEVVY